MSSSFKTPSSRPTSEQDWETAGSEGFTDLALAIFKEVDEVDEDGGQKLRAGDWWKQFKRDAITTLSP